MKKSTKRSQMKRSTLKSNPQKTKNWHRRSRQRLATRSPLHCRGPIKPRKVSKRETVDGDSERAIRDECDELIRKILKLRDRECIIFGCGQTRGLHPGHYIPRGIFAVRWDLRNNHLQCDPCNSDHNTNREPYREAMLFIYGSKVVEELEQIEKDNPRLEYTDLLAIRDGLRGELARLKTR